MAAKQNMLSTALPWDAVATGYEQVTMKLFQGYSDQALAMSGLDRNADIVDIACGPGTLAIRAAQLVNSVNAVDFSPAMIDLLAQKKQQLNIDNLDFYCGDGQALRYEDTQFDAAFSMFGLMFFPDRVLGMREMHRVLREGGKALISSWAPVADSPAMETTFGTLRAMNPGIPAPKFDVESLENPEVIRAELSQAGFKDIETKRVSQSFNANSIDEYLADLVTGTAPIVMLKRNMTLEQWQQCLIVAREHLVQTLGEGPISLSADAWLALATK